MISSPSLVEVTKELFRFITKSHPEKGRNTYTFRMAHGKIGIN